MNLVMGRFFIEANIRMAKSMGKVYMKMRITDMKETFSKTNVQALEHMKSKK